MCLASKARDRAHARSLVWRWIKSLEWPEHTLLLVRDLKTAGGHRFEYAVVLQPKHVLPPGLEWVPFTCALGAPFVRALARIQTFFSKPIDELGSVAQFASNTRGFVPLHTLADKGVRMDDPQLLSDSRHQDAIRAALESIIAKTTTPEIADPLVGWMERLVPTDHKPLRDVVAIGRNGFKEHRHLWQVLSINECRQVDPLDKIEHTMGVDAIKRLMESCPDQELVSRLTHGVQYDAGLAQQIVLNPHLTTLGMCIQEVDVELRRLWAWAGTKSILRESFPLCLVGLRARRYSTQI